MSDKDDKSSSSKVKNALPKQRENERPVTRVKDKKRPAEQRDPQKKVDINNPKLCKFLSPAVREKCALEARDMAVTTDEKCKVEAMRQYFDQYWLSIVYQYKQRRGRRHTVEKLITDHPEWDERKREEFRRDHLVKESQLLRCQRARMTVQNFMLLAIIGRGGFGEVYLCRKRDTGEVLALKKLVKKYFLQKNDVGKLKRERDVMVKNDSPWLIKLKYSFQSENYVYLAMEFVPGGDMKNLLDHVGGFEEEHARFYFSEMLLAVQALHNMGYIHRDLKPDNFLVDRTGHLKLIDFGLSQGGHTLKYEGTLSLRPKSGMTAGNPGNSMKISDINSSNNTSGGQKYMTKHRYRTGRKVFSIVGSPEYMAIEILEEIGYNHTVDYWSLGVILYELFYGITPFNSESSEEALQKLSSYKDYIIPPPDLKDDSDIQVSGEAWDLIERLLTEPSKRIGKGKIDEIKEHPFFSGFDWENVIQMEPPFVPSLSSDMDTAYFADALDDEDYSSLTLNVNDLQEMLGVQGDAAEHNIPLHLINVTTKEEANLEHGPTYFKNEYEQTAFAGWTFKHQDMQPLINKFNQQQQPPKRRSKNDEDDD